MQAILFDIGSSRGNAEAFPPSLYSLKRNLFPCKDKKERLSWINYLPTYSDKVLLGNWFERRAVNSQSFDDDWISIYKSSFEPHDVKDLKGDTMYESWKNREKIRGSTSRPIVPNQTIFDIDEDTKANKNRHCFDEESSIQSIYQLDYSLPKDVFRDLNYKRFPKPRGDMNTPDLRHLATNSSLISHHFVPCKPQYPSLNS